MITEITQSNPSQSLIEHDILLQQLQLHYSGIGTISYPLNSGSYYYVQEAKTSKYILEITFPGNRTSQSGCYFPQSDTRSHYRFPTRADANIGKSKTC